MGVQGIDPQMLFKTKKKELEMSEIDLKIAALETADIPDWRKTMMKKELQFQKKLMAHEKKQAEIGDI